MSPSASTLAECDVLVCGGGAATALALEQGCDLAAVDVRRRQRTLKNDGVCLDDVPET